MSKRKEPENKTKTEDLIDEALKSFEDSQRSSAGFGSASSAGFNSQTPSDEIRSAERNPDYDQTDGKKVARIDVKQYVEKEAFMRLAADFDNFRKRVLKERGEWERQGKEKVLRGFLDILDNLKRGLSQPDSQMGPLAEGMRMVLSQAEAWLASEGLQRIATIGEMFDPALHEAVAKVQDLSKPDGMIIEETRCGYRWGDRLLRPASVVVVKSNDSGVVSGGEGVNE